MKNKPTQCAPVRPLAIRVPVGFSLRMLWGEPFLIMSENETLVVSKDDEIRDLKRTLENTRDQLSKSLDVVVSLSIRNVELTNELKTLTSNAL